MRARLPSGKRSIAAADLFAQHELELPELIRLKPARRFEPLSKRLELERGHCLENVELCNQDFEDRQDALQRMLRAIGVAHSSSAITRSTSCSSCLNHSS